MQRRAMGPTGRVSSGGGYDGLDWIQVPNGHPESITPPSTRCSPSLSNWAAMSLKQDERGVVELYKQKQVS